MLGTGYVGLVSGTCFAELGFTVSCVDNNIDKINSLKQGIIPILEPKLEELVNKNIKIGRLTFTTNLQAGIEGAELIFIAVGTPPCPASGKADLTQVESLIKALAPLLQPGVVIVMKSTVPVGTGRRVAAIIKEINPQAHNAVVSNPEFLREGCAVEDFLHPARIIVGVEDEHAASLLHQIYLPLTNLGVPLLSTSIETSELIKYAANCFLATKLSFINEIANICEKTNANVEEVALGLGLDPRIGATYLKVGPGYGGSCFPKDTIALINSARDLQIPLSIIEAVVKSNALRKELMVQKIVATCHGSVAHKKLAILGLTFKANTNDVRDSPAVEIIKLLHKAGATLSVYDPGVTEPLLLEEVPLQWCASIDLAIKDAEAVIILTEWEEFASLDLKKMKSLLKLSSHKPILIDLRNLYDPVFMAKNDIHYVSIGRNYPVTNA